MFVPFRRKCCVCGGFAIWPFWRLRGTSLMSPFNPDGRAVWIHRGHCTFCHEYYVQKCGQDGILAVKFEHQHCCICGGGRGFFFRKEISSTTLTSGYNPNGEPVFVHSGDCHQAFLTSHAALSQRREMAQFMQQLQNLKK